MKKANKEKMFDNDLTNGIVNYDNFFNGFIYEYSGDGFTDEILLGGTLEEAYKTYCEING